MCITVPMYGISCAFDTTSLGPIGGAKARSRKIPYRPGEISPSRQKYPRGGHENPLHAPLMPRCARPSSQYRNLPIPTYMPTILRGAKRGQSPTKLAIGAPHGPKARHHPSSSGQKCHTGYWKTHFLTPKPAILFTRN
jgi:hypothetical protein